MKGIKPKLIQLICREFRNSNETGLYSLECFLICDHHLSTQVSQKACLSLQLFWVLTLFLPRLLRLNPHLIQFATPNPPKSWSPHDLWGHRDPGIDLRKSCQWDKVEIFQSSFPWETNKTKKRYMSSIVLANQISIKTLVFEIMKKSMSLNHCWIQSWHVLQIRSHVRCKIRHETILQITILQGRWNRIPIGKCATIWCTMIFYTYTHIFFFFSSLTQSHRWHDSDNLLNIKNPCPFLFLQPWC